MGALWEYSQAPGDPGNPIQSWPASSRLPRAGDRWTLVMAVHPHCPCSSASIGELATLMARRGTYLHAFVLFVQPQGFTESWTKSGLWRSAAAIPGVTPIVDEDGSEARLFGAATSGQTLVYDHAGHLSFAGGITAARGHWGDNAGVSAIQVLLKDGGLHGAAHTPVYGCALFARNSKGAREREVCPR